jgi:hypothetical protein
MSSHKPTNQGEIAARNQDLHHYNLIASAIAGRSITVHWHGSQQYRAYSDGRSIFLPGAAVASTDADSNQALTVIAQALLLRAGSLRRRWIQRMVGQRQLAERYLYAEVCRATREFNPLLPRQFTSISALTDFSYHPHNSDASYKLARSKRVFPEIPTLVGTLRPVLLLKENVADEAFSALTEKQQFSKLEFKPADELDDDTEDKDESNALKLFQNPLSSSSKIAELLNDILGAGRSGSPEENPNTGGEAGMPAGSITQAKKKGLFSTLTDLALDLVNSDNGNDTGSQRYPEWDYVKQEWHLVKTKLPSMPLLFNVCPCLMSRDI